MRKTLAALCGFFIACGIAQAQNSSGTQTLTVANAACVSGSCVQLKFDSNDVASATISLSGAFTATVQFEASNDGLALSDANKVWVAISGTPLNGTTAVSSATTANVWKFNVASSTDIRARCSVFTSAPTVIIKSSRAVANATGGGGTSLPALSDNGTIVTSTEQILVPAGTITSPSIQWAEATANAGWFRPATNVYDFSIGNSAVQMRIQNAATGNVVVKDVLGFSTNPNATAPDLMLRRQAAASLQFGAADAAAPVAQTMGPQSVVTGTSNIAGARWTLRPSLGTGNAAGAAIAIQRDLMLGSGSTVQSAADAFAVGQSKTLSNTSATAQAIATITLGSNAGGGASGIFTLVCTDGTNFDSETQSFNVSFVNKATVVTVGTPAITTSTAANNSGSCTLGITAVANGNNIDLKVTPVFSTIVPTTVTLYPIITHSTNTVTFN